jgi:lipase
MRLSVTEWGDPAGSPVVCLHGVTGHGRRFRRLAEERLPSYRVVGVDYRGHGASTWEPPWSVEQHVADLVDTAIALGIESAVWVGHSFGGKLVAELAARHPGRVERAVLLDPALHIEPPVAMERAELTRLDVSFVDADDAIEARLGDGSLFTTPRETLEEETREHLVQGDDGRFRWQYAPSAVIVAWSEMATGPPPWPQCPTLVVTGERTWIPIRVPRIGNIAHVLVPGGHSVMWDDFDATADAIVRFLGSA